MAYDEMFDRWVVKMSEKEISMSCGEHLKVIIAGHTIPCRLELARDWYVIMDGARFDLRKTDKYIVQLG